MEIMIVDDDRDSLESVGKFLEIFGHKCILFDSAAPALKIYQETFPPLIITDLKMPVISGLDLITSIKKLKPSQPILVITGFADDEETAAALRLGATAVLEKPLDIEQLLAYIDDFASTTKYS